MWVEQERTRFRSRIARILADAASAAAAEGRWAEAVARTHRLLAVAPYEASSAQLAATTLISAGRRQEARELLKKFATTLDTDLGLPMPPELQSLLSRLERQPAESEPTARARATTRDGTLPFVGRESEISQLVSLCRTTAEEAGGFALIKGESGIGKSRLLAELMANVRSLGRITVLHGREHVAGLQLPYAVFAEALRPLVRAPGVLGASKHLLAEAARLLPELRDEIELPAVTDVEDEAGRLRFFEGIAALMDAAAFERPVVLIVDDVHLAGPSTLELLSYLCARLARSAVTLVFTLRPSDAPASMLARLEAIARPDSQTHPGRALSLSLGTLDARASHDAVAQSLKGMGLEPAAVERIVERAAGVPALLADLVRRVSRGEPVASAPVSVREIVVDRVAALTSVQRRLLFVIALIGRPTTRSIAGAAAHIPDAAVGDALDTLVAEGLVEIDAQGVIEIDDGALNSALELAGASTRAFLSGWIADELSTRSAPAADLARFYAAAGQARPAFEQSRLAAFAAIAVGALPEATYHLQVARTFAQTPADVAAVEALLTAVGAGKRQIVTPATAAPPAEPSPPRTTPVPASQFEALFPNWRVLLGAAIATLAVTSLVLADRSGEAADALNLPTGDTLVVAEDEAQRVLRIATGDMSRGFVLSQRRAASASDPGWIDSLPRPWSTPVRAPNGDRVAVHRITATGSDLFLISADRRDTTPLFVNAGDARALSWSPDGRWLLASLAPSDGSFDAGLIAMSGFEGRVVRRTIESAARRSVTEAAWAPDGTRIAWVARVGDDRQLEVFVSNADGSGARNISRDPADDHHIAWSPDGKLLAFTSARDGNSELYAHSFLENRLFRLTNDPAQDDGAEFSSDGRLVAFESTRGGSAAVYVMPALGGDPRRIPADASLGVVRWHGGAARHVDRVLVQQPVRVRRGDTASLRLVAFDQSDEPLGVSEVQWRVLDSLALRRVDGGEGADLRVTARESGVARVVASVGGWRSDTAIVALGSSTITLLGRNDGLRFWRALGSPRPTITEGTITLASDREWESGILSRGVTPLLPGLVLQAALEIPLTGARDPAASVTLSLVVPEDSANVDPEAPQFLRLASMSWNAASGRFVYAVGREFFSEPVSVVAPSGESQLPIHIRVEADSTISFRVRGDERWRSSLRALSGHRSARAQVWISARATAGLARLLNASIRLEPVPVSDR